MLEAPFGVAIRVTVPFEKSVCFDSFELENVVIEFFP